MNPVNRFIESFYDIRVEFEKQLYTHAGPLHINMSPDMSFGISKSQSSETVYTGYGPNPMGLVDESDCLYTPTFTDEILNFLVRMEKIPEKIEAASLRIEAAA